MFRVGPCLGFGFWAQGVVLAQLNAVVCAYAHLKTFFGQSKDTIQGPSTLKALPNILKPLDP